MQPLLLTLLPSLLSPLPIRLLPLLTALLLLLVLLLMPLPRRRLKARPPMRLRRLRLTALPLLPSRRSSKSIVTA